jgi:hypothetical protein
VSLRPHSSPLPVVRISTPRGSIRCTNHKLVIRSDQSITEPSRIPVPRGVDGALGGAVGKSWCEGWKREVAIS